jgi:hypothetical protein
MVSQILVYFYVQVMSPPPSWISQISSNITKITFPLKFEYLGSLSPTLYIKLILIDVKI